MADIDGTAEVIMGRLIPWETCASGGTVGSTIWPQDWQDLGRRFSNTGLGSYAGIRFEDINGDGGDDAMWVDDGGKTYIWTNSRSCRKGYVGDGLNVAWRQTFYKGASSDPTHMGIGGINQRTRIHFARINGQSSVFGNLPLQGYVYLEHTKLAGDQHRFEM
ncbi:hypothetical protein CGCSCA5_v010832 [Colletotrichum siamense]|nr:hypothetical protein CGCSCA5_v010832 [Colletotrichum siamense]